jgi:hypothetical protein
MLVGTLSDIEKIFLVLAILYLIESVFWVRRGAAAFSSVAGRFLGTGQSFTVISNEVGRVLLSGPLPNDASFIAQPIPISIASGGVVGFLIHCPTESQQPIQTHRFFDWHQLVSTTAFEKQVLVEEQLLCSVQSFYAARLLASKLVELAKLPEQERRIEIDRWTASEFDTEATFVRIDRWRSQTRNLGRSILAFFIWIFPFGLTYYSGIIPGSYHPYFLVGYLTGFFGWWWWTVWRVYWDHRALLPDHRLGRLKSVLTSFISPGAALRSRDHLARELFTFVHPATLAATLLPKAMLVDHARRIWRDLEYPMYPIEPEGVDGAGSAVASVHHLRSKCLIEKLFQSKGLRPEDLTASPTPFDSATLAYCPRCLREYTQSDAKCTPCGERPTLAI